MISKIFIVFHSLKIDFVLTNSVDPDEMLHFAAFHLGLHCLPLNPSRVYQGHCFCPEHVVCYLGV